MTSGVPHYDPFSRAINLDPYPTFRRLRDEAPVYRNEEHDFYALSRYDDVHAARLDAATFVSGRGSAPLERMPNTGLTPRMLLEMDPPDHACYRLVLNRRFTPKAINQLEPGVRALVREHLAPFEGVAEFDYVHDFVRHIPMRATCALLGIDREEQDPLIELMATRDVVLSAMGDVERIDEVEQAISDRIMTVAKRRAVEPEDDLLSVLVHAEIDDPATGRRPLTEDEIAAYALILFTGGNSTTTFLMGWAVTLLAEHPDQRKLLVDDPTLIANAVEEILRYEPVSHIQGRYTSRDVVIHDTTVPAGSKVLLLTASACRDERRYDAPDDFEVRRDVGNQMAFGRGIHACIGAPLARLEARVLLEETLARFPSWTVDEHRVERLVMSVMRGCSRVPFAPAA